VEQFTVPNSWTIVRWGSLLTTKRSLQVCLILLMNQIIELNAFFLKATFEIPSEFAFNLLRLFLVAFICLPSLRQTYVYFSDPLCKRIGTQCWVGVGIMLTEMLIWVKFGFMRRDAPWSLNQLLRTFPVWLATLVVFTFVSLNIAALLEKVPFFRRLGNYL